MTDDLASGLTLPDNKKEELDVAPTAVLAGIIKAAELIAMTKPTQDRPEDHVTYAIRVHANRQAEAEQERHVEIVKLRKDANCIAQWALGISILAIIVSVAGAITFVVGG
jgi:hypothetical protein